jgi:hypothetical protein
MRASLSPHDATAPRTSPVFGGWTFPQEQFTFASRAPRAVRREPCVIVVTFRFAREHLSVTGGHRYGV